MGIDLSDESIEQPGYNPKESEDALKERCRAMFDMYVDFVRRGIIVESHYENAKKLAQKYGFSTKDLEDSLLDGLRKQFDNRLELIKSGRDDYAKIAETAKVEAEKYGYSVAAVSNAKAVGSKTLEEIKERKEKTRKPDVLEMKMKAKK